MAVVVHAAWGADGAADAVGARRDVRGMFDDVAKGVFGGSLAALEKREGAPG